MKVVGKETSPQYIQQNELSFIPNNYQLEMDIAVPVNVVFYFFFFLHTGCLPQWQGDLKKKQFNDHLHSLSCQRHADTTV